ncbi:hypothetical protein NEOLEDRAFT_1240628 [Neolentinus lepideus HHB14362 ss-1]|uniref:WKF domain-containing protein n=1 Tax=Neolentinus lepideus HHB14362 ss-1 TaxID=1314782 RepID=A0A165TP56_9AGAM|nr:hypothetical protein NEOLEDRAFT_1240628 [Neolentinus lepideus HHB14362 ss-1]
MAVEITEDTVRKAEKRSKKAQKDETSEEKEKEHKKSKAVRQARAEEGELEREDRKGKKKKRKLDEDQWVAVEDRQGKKRKKKRSKQEHDAAEVPLNNSEGAPETVEVSIGPSLKKRKHKRKDSGAHTDLPGESSQDVEEETVESEKKSKSKHKSTTGDGEMMPVEKKKKRHKMSDSAAEADERERPKSKKRKHSKKDTGYPDPTEDSTLSEQASKALNYARSQFSNPDTWKFNKARQNWLTRNVWSAESIPDTYMPLVTRYLSKVQGGVRENLLKVCNATLAASVPSVLTAESVEKSPLKSILKSSSAAKDEEAAANAVEQSAQPSILTDQTKRFRAEALLQALSSQATNAADTT